MPVNHESDSVDQIQRLADQFGKQCGYVVVRNAAHSDSFALFESSEVRAQLKDKLGGREIAMTRLQDWLVEALNAENVTITAATKHPAFSLLDRQRLQTWQRKLYAEIESVAELAPAHQVMPMPNTEQPDFDEDFERGRRRVARATSAARRRRGAAAGRVVPNPPAALG